VVSEGERVRIAGVTSRERLHASLRTGTGEFYTPVMGYAPWLTLKSDALKTALRGFVD